MTPQGHLKKQGHTLEVFRFSRSSLLSVILMLMRVLYCASICTVKITSPCSWTLIVVRHWAHVVLKLLGITKTTNAKALIFTDTDYGTQVIFSLICNTRIQVSANICVFHKSAYPVLLTLKGVTLEISSISKFLTTQPNPAEDRTEVFQIL